MRRCDILSNAERTDLLFHSISGPQERSPKFAGQSHSIRLHCIPHSPLTLCVDPPTSPYPIHLCVPFCSLGFPTPSPLAPHALTAYPRPTHRWTPSLAVLSTRSGRRCFRLLSSPLKSSSTEAVITHPSSEPSSKLVTSYATYAASSVWPMPLLVRLFCARPLRPSPLSIRRGGSALLISSYLIRAMQSNPLLAPFQREMVCVFAAMI